ncbi:hypothetical protein RF11_13688 [Thelohanellus kitauei]|uniref:Uncharacterized protein n=1 Tax=Thelohanellus kitauei TaxID=669202 RepID=A0A0C2JNC5_THEKT|nr:hypothetical protein RF11_13688 [Thelohanellus kitauei]
MSESSHVSQAINMTQQSTTVDLLKKEVAIPRIRTFHLIMKQDKESRYFVIKDMNESTGNNRIIVPMDHCEKFVHILYLVRRLSNEYLSMDPSQRTHRDSDPIFIENMYTDVGRKYYFDVYDNTGDLYVKLT